MLGILLLYFIGKAFYSLAEDFTKSKWLWAILGIIGYYAGTFIGGIVIALIMEFGLEEDISTINDFLLGFMAMPFGLAACWGMYTLLKKQWSASPESDDQLLDA